MECLFTYSFNSIVIFSDCVLIMRAAKGRAGAWITKICSAAYRLQPKANVAKAPLEPFSYSIRAYRLPKIATLLEEATAAVVGRLLRELPRSRQCAINRVILKKAVVRARLLLFSPTSICGSVGLCREASARSLFFAACVGSH